jgi:hypothetical protein
MYGFQIGSKCHILHAKYDQVYPIGAVLRGIPALYNLHWQPCWLHCMLACLPEYPRVES